MIRHPLRPFWIFALTLFVNAASAHTQPNASGVNAADGPEAVVEKLTTRVITSIEHDKTLQSGDPESLQKLVEEQILPFLDFDRTTRLAAGLSWRRATVEQRARLTQEFRTLLVRTYAGALSAAPNYKVKMLSPGAGSNKDAVVRTQVVAADREPVQLDYRLERTDAGWKIYDINVAGVWLVEVYRSSFAEEISRGGIDGLIKDLAERNRQSLASSSP